ncbi:TapY2 family type IVa secretion system protein [Colwellia sp. PAMC 21821]|uniref:TapY2 family type IVa secretion system protein n=1 Tax=Colwellia sp. PAMC 21821 TaxID=1816219 RepID=UPI0009C18C51|nr:TapY2 family type IVa secretion system protein [Colwellia sp. PAMC 21821]ARD45415.1 hypothetical protein A3Q33_14615 [Colwellia sp. PAMC 21821]
MKNKIFFISLIVLFNTSFSTTAATKAAKNYNVDAKCHVELVNGEEMIYFASIKESKINKLVDTLPNRKIPTHFSREKLQVKRAFECVLMDAKFISSKANEFFDKQPR